MGFWGMEMKPRKDYPVSKVEGKKLRLTQEELKDYQDHSVGDKKAGLLCTLIPNRIETCALNHNFEEEEDVIFSVEGRTVSLTGYSTSKG